MDDVVRLPPEPQSAGRARRWVRDRLTRTGHPELVEPAVLAISELVTNAVLHARTAITVRLRAEDEVLIEVSDASNTRLHPGTSIEPPDDTLPTLGNGLHIVGVLARSWGVRANELGGREGKTVWFVPGRNQNTAGGASPCEQPPQRHPSELDSAAGVKVVIAEAPVRLLWQTHFRVRDLRREMLMLARRDTEPDSVPHRLIEIADDVDDLNVAVLVGDESLEAAVHRADEFLTLHYDVPPTAGMSCAQLADLLDEADEYCRREQLLTLAATPRERAVRRWFLGEFDRQVRGEPPRPWRTGAAQA